MTIYKIGQYFFMIMAVVMVILCFHFFIYPAFGAPCENAPRGSINCAEATGTISATVVSDVATITQDPDTGKITVEVGDPNTTVFMDCQSSDGNYICSF